MPTYREYFSELKERIKEATPEQVHELLRSGDVQLGDVREKNEWDEGHIVGATHVPKSYLEQWAEERLPDKSKMTILYCAGGVRSAMAADTLAKLGYTDVISMTGGSTAGRTRASRGRSPSRSVRSRRSGTHGICSSQRSARPDSTSFSRARSCSSAPVVSVHRRRTTSPRQGWVSWGSSTPMSSTSRTYSAKFSIRPNGSVSRRSNRRSELSRRP